MNPNPILCLALVLSGALFGCSTPDHLSPRRTVSYSKPSYGEKIKVEHVTLGDQTLVKLAALPKSKTPFASRWLVEGKPDTMHNGPWNTRLYIFDSSDTNQCVRVDLIDHASYDVQHNWLNEKLLFVSVPWGRIVWTDFVLNTETMRFAYIEDGMYVEMFLLEQERESKSMQIPRRNAP